MAKKKENLPNGKKTKGRVKIKMEFIDNKLRKAIMNLGCRYIFYFPLILLGRGGQIEPCDAKVSY